MIILSTVNSEVFLSSVQDECLKLFPAQECVIDRLQRMYVSNIKQNDPTCQIMSKQVSSPE